MSIREEPCRFGIPILDEELGGGYSRGSTILVEDEVGIDAHPLLVQYLSEGLANGEYGYILSTEHLYDTYRQLLIPFGIDEIVVETKRLIFLDGFSTPFGSDKPGAISTRGPQNLIRDILQPRMVIDTIRQSLMHVRNPNIRGVFDSISSVILMSDNSLKTSISLLSQIVANNKATRNNTIFTIHSDSHSKEIIKALEHYLDGVLKLTFDPNGQPILRIIKSEGISKKEKNDFRYLPEPGKVIIERMGK